MTETAPVTGLSVRGLTKTFGQTRAVDGVSFDVDYGTVTGFVGANGSGKTTTIRMILGLIKPDEGEALIAGKRYSDLKRPRDVVGAVIDRIGAHPAYTARRHLEMIATAANIELANVEPCLEEVELLDVADQQIGRFSMGMTQRCALAAALLASPEILILDEPANGLDPSGIRWLRGKIESWASNGKAVLVSSHQLSELARVVDSLVVLDRGALVYAGDIGELTKSGNDLEDAVFNLVS